MGFLGPKSEAKEILKKTVIFLASELALSVNFEKTKLMHHDKGVVFLGHRIVGSCAHSRFGSRYIQQIGSNQLKLKVPLEKLLRCYADRGFLKIAKYGKRLRYVGCRQEKWFYLMSDVDVIRRYSAIITELLRFYSGSTSQSALSQIFRLLKRSAALTLAQRHKMRFVWQAYKR